MIPLECARYYLNTVNHWVANVRRMVKKRYFTAREVAETLAISKQTLLRYEAKGIFPKAGRNQVNKWREYTQTDIQKLRQIMGR